MRGYSFHNAGFLAASNAALEGKFESDLTSDILDATQGTAVSYSALNDRIDFNLTKAANAIPNTVNESGIIDIQTRIGQAIQTGSTAKWLLQYKIVITGASAGDTDRSNVLLGLTDGDETADSTTNPANYMGMVSDLDSPGTTRNNFISEAVEGAIGAYNDGFGSDMGNTLTALETWYVDNIRNGNNFTVSLYPTIARVTPTHTDTRNITSLEDVFLRYFKLQNVVATANPSTNNLIGYIEDEFNFYNGSITPF